jgi:hypothetical protein
LVFVFHFTDGLYYIYCLWCRFICNIQTRGDYVLSNRWIEWISFTFYDTNRAVTSNWNLICGCNGYASVKSLAWYKARQEIIELI